MPTQRTTEHGDDVVPTALLGDFTMVHDRARNRPVLRLQGQVILPLGAEVELGSPDVSATVIGIRLRTGSPDLPAHVCLEVDVPAEYWDDFATLGAAIERHMRATTPERRDASARSDQGRSPRVGRAE